MYHWNSVAKFVGTRNKEQCRGRYRKLPSEWRVSSFVPPAECSECIPPTPQGIRKRDSRGRTGPQRDALVVILAEYTERKKTEGWNATGDYWRRHAASFPRCFDGSEMPWEWLREWVRRRHLQKLNVASSINVE